MLSKNECFSEPAKKSRKHQFSIFAFSIIYCDNKAFGSLGKKVPFLLAVAKTQEKIKTPEEQKTKSIMQCGSSCTAVKS